MDRISFRTFSSLTLASLVLAVVIIGRIPTSECPCSKPEQQQDSECPFGKLRLLASFALGSDFVVLSIPNLRFEEVFAVQKFTFAVEVLSAYSPRAPPFVSDLF